MDPKVSLGLFPSFFNNYWISLKIWKVLRDFRIFWVGFPILTFDLVPVFFGMFALFLCQFLVFKKVLNPQFVDQLPLFWFCFRFSNKKLNSQFVDRFPFLGLFSLFLSSFPLFCLFPLFLCLFPVFKKCLKFSVCWCCDIHVKSTLQWILIFQDQLITFGLS